MNRRKTHKSFSPSLSDCSFSIFPHTSLFLSLIFPLPHVSIFLLFPLSSCHFKTQKYLKKSWQRQTFQLSLTIFASFERRDRFVLENLIKLFIQELQKGRNTSFRKDEKILLQIGLVSELLSYLSKGVSFKSNLVCVFPLFQAILLS